MKTKAVLMEDLQDIPREVTEEDEQSYLEMISIELTDEQKQRILDPPTVYPRQTSMIAVHWHPEFVPVDLIRQRVDTLFPNLQDQLIIPTQHNELTSYGKYTGVEIDCYSPSFNRKTQLLFHFANDKIENRGDVFKAMLVHTYNYRASQLEEFFDSLLDAKFESRLEQAASDTGAEPGLIEFVKIQASKLRWLMERHESRTPLQKRRNKIIRDFIDKARNRYEASMINRAQIFLRAVKELVKAQFSLKFFYKEQEFIEEGRSLGACIVIPHPEQFWPILLEDLDVDAIEVWNPQSSEYTQFLIQVVGKKNRSVARGYRPLLVTMGDDCHFGEKVKDPRYQDSEKASREIGVQPLWEDLDIGKSLLKANVSRERVIQEYRDRLES